MAETKAPISVAEAQARKRQHLFLSVIVGVIAVVAVGMAYVSTPKTGKDAGKGPETRSIQIGGANSDKEAFIAQFRADQERQRKELEELRAWRRSVEERDTRQQAESRARSALGPAPTLPPAAAPNGQAVFTVASAPPPPPPAPAAAPRPTPAAPAGPSLKLLAVASQPAAPAPASSNATKEQERGRIGEERAPADSNVQNYVPSGTFARAVLLNGLDAPTGGNAQQNPHPVLLQLLDDATLPNGFRSRLQACFATASGHGDISSERAFIRLDRLSCVDENGGAVDIKIQGYVAGEDGKAGMRGRLVTKSGQVLANALLTGLLSGLGKGVQQEATQQNTTIAGAVTSQVTNPWRAGIGEGVGKAFEDVSRWYLKLADKIFPIVEVDAGRVVDLVITRGVSIERR